jgi:PKD repeat protein
MNSRVGTVVVACAALLAGCGGSSEGSQGGVPQAIPTGALEAGLRVSLTAAPVAAGSRTVEFTAPVADDDGSAPSWTIDFGDGTTKELKPAPGSCAGSSRSAATPVSTTITVTHRYAKPGTYAAQIVVVSGGPCALPAPETETAYTLVTVA